MGTGTRLYVPAGRIVTVNGALVINNAEWVRFHDQNGACGIVVNGTMSATGPVTRFEDVNSAYNNLGTTLR